MSYFDLGYAFLLLPIVVLIYNITPKKYRKIVLLIASFVFFYIISKMLIIFLIMSILSIYGGALWLSKIDEFKKKELENTEVDKKVIICILNNNDI